MKSKKTRIGIVVLVALSLVATLLVGACTKPAPAPAPSPAPGVEKPEAIKAAFALDITGLYSWTPYTLQGAKDYFAMINEEGGIDGVPMKVVWADCKQDAALTVAAYKRWKMEGVTLVYVCSSAQMNAIKAATAEDSMPCVVQSIGTDLFFPPTPNIYTLHHCEANWSLATLEYFLDLWEESHAQPLNLGVIMWEAGVTLPDIPVYEAWCKDNGVNLVGIERHPPPALEVKTELGRLKAKGADAILICAVAPLSWRAVRDMGELGMLPGLEVDKDGNYTWNEGGITALGPMNTTTESGWEQAGKWAGYTFGHMDMETYPFVDMDKAPGFKQMWESMRFTYEESTCITHQCEYAYGWKCAMIMAAAAERTVEKVGWEGFSREAICKVGLPGLEFDTEGLSGPISYADYPDDRGALGWHKWCVFDTEKGVRRNLSKEWVEYDKLFYDKGYYPGIPNTKVK